MKELSTEVIEIGGKEYTLFLNRRGVVAFEHASKLLNTAKELLKTDVESETPSEELGDINPLEYYGDMESKEEKELKTIRRVVKKFYWIALYTNYSFNEEKVSELIDQAEKEYGLEQLIDLSSQMISDVNGSPEAVQETKKLKALRPKTEEILK